MKQESSENSASEFDGGKWNNNRLYSIQLPGKAHRLSLDCDHHLSTPQSRGDDLWEVVPIVLQFENVSDLKLDFNQGCNTEIDIVAISRSNEMLTPNGKLTSYEFCIELAPSGEIKFRATGFLQKCTGRAVLSYTYDVGRTDSDENSSLK